MLCANDMIFCYSSQLDGAGNDNNGILHKYLEQNPENLEINFDFTPRADQQPVLDYKQGKMAVPAVPGAGKTTILLALIMKLMQDKVKPEEILVLTYMDSAAENIREKIKKSCPTLIELPHISTIHGLAYKIIKDEDNFTKLGLTSDFELCDDSIRPGIIASICEKYLPFGEEDIKGWIKLNTESISAAKHLNITYHDIEKFLSKNDYQQLTEFLPIYKEYTIKLRERNMIDFDDMLGMATKLVKEFPEIRKYYQKKYKYVIEDEAQDSSKIQQELISIITEYHGNLVRTGDVNQAITTTFSNADVLGFRDFAKQNHSIKMTSSQRCAKEIYELANQLVNWSLEQEDLKNSFFPIYMEPVEGQNPETYDSLHFKRHETPDDEKDWVLNEIIRIRELSPDDNFGILLRGNASVIKWARFLEEKELPYICFTDSLGQKKVFKLLLKYLEVLFNPWDNKLIIELYKELICSKLYRHEFDSMAFLSRAGSPFVSFKLTDLPTETLIKFRMDIQYWLDNSGLPPETLVIKLGNYLFRDIIDRSNVQLFSILITRYKHKFTDYEANKPVTLPDIIEHFKELGKKNRISGVKFFVESGEEDPKTGLIHIMTVHKAKGLGFDNVFMPEMHENMYSYSITSDNIKLSTKNKLLTQLNKIIESKLKKTDLQSKLDQVEEHMRLIYVGITRAKKHLYMSSSSKIKKWEKFEDNQPSKVLEYFISDKSVIAEVNNSKI